MSAIKRWIATLATLILMGCVLEAWAGPTEEVLQFVKPRLQALQDGDLDAYTAAYADNAVFHSSLTAFRIEGISPFERISPSYSNCTQRAMSFNASRLFGLTTTTWWFRTDTRCSI